MAAPSRILVCGSINTDMVIRGPRLPAPGETVLDGEFYLAPGGKGANQAVAAARAARSPVTFVGAVGDDTFGRDSLAGLRQENLICDFIRSIPGEASGVALILVDHAGQNLISVASGANAQLTGDDLDAVPERVWSEARVFLTCLETPLNAVVHGLKCARRHGLTTILNPAPAPPDLFPPDVLALVDILTPNESEAAAIAGLSPPSESADLAGAEQAAMKLKSLGSRTVIVTLGSAGCLIADSEIRHVPARQVRAVDATAAGDAFNGALAVALAEEKSLRDAVDWAMSAAALSVTKRGAQPSLPHREQINVFHTGQQASGPRI